MKSFYFKLWIFLKTFSLDVLLHLHTISENKKL